MGRMTDYHYYWAQLGSQPLGIRVARTKGIAIMAFVLSYELTQEEELNMTVKLVNPITVIKHNEEFYLYCSTHHNPRVAVAKAQEIQKRPKLALWFNRDDAKTRPQQNHGIHKSLLRKFRDIDLDLGRAEGMSFGGDATPDISVLETWVTKGMSLREIAYHLNTNVPYLKGALLI
jgi:hypothetical protein